MPRPISFSSPNQSASLTQKAPDNTALALVLQQMQREQARPDPRTPAEGGLRALNQGLQGYFAGQLTRGAEQKDAARRKAVADMLIGSSGGGAQPASAPAQEGGDPLFNAMVQQESGGNPNAVSSKGATGLMQVMPATARDPGYGVTPFDPNKPLTDPQENARFGQEYYNALMQHYGNRDDALRAYNAGPGRVDQWIKAGRPEGGLPQETRDYVKSINAMTGGERYAEGLGGQTSPDPRIQQLAAAIEGGIVSPEKGYEMYLDMTKPDRMSSGDLVEVQTPQGPRLVPADQAVGQIPYEKPTKPSAMDAKINEIMQTYGVDRRTAAGVATGAVSIKTNPDTGNQELVNAVTGKARMLDYARPGDTPPPQAGQEGAANVNQQVAQAVQETGNTLWSSVEGVPGLEGFFTELYGRTFGQLPGAELGQEVEGVIDNRQFYRLAQNDLIRSISINPRFPVAEMNRIKEETDLEPNIWDSQGALRTRMTRLDSFLRNRLENERRAAQDRTLPAKTRQNAAAAAKDIENFLGIMGVPQGQGGGNAGQSPQPGTVEEGYRFKGGDPSNRENWERAQ